MRASASRIVRLTVTSALDCTSWMMALGFYEQLLAKLIGLTFELIDPILGLPQLS
jgi:hypothetical protein